MSRPRFNQAERAEIARRYQDGESMPALAEGYGCSVTMIDRALSQAGVPSRGHREAAGLVWDQLRVCRECGGPVKPHAPRPLCPPCGRRFCQGCDQRLPEAWGSRYCRDCRFRQRYKARPPKLCRVCGRMQARGSRRQLCSVHTRMFCQQCEVALPRGRVCHYCPECERAKKEKLWAKPGRRCSLCGTGAAVLHSSWCRRCQHEDYEARKRALAKIERPCVQCGEGLSKGRRVNRCVTCQRAHERQRRRERQLLGLHRCAQCSAALSLRQDTYCSGCAGLLARWRRDWHAGVSEARIIGTVQSRKKRAAPPPNAQGEPGNDGV